MGLSRRYKLLSSKLVTVTLDGAVARLAMSRPSIQPGPGKEVATSVTVAMEAPSTNRARRVVWPLGDEAHYTFHRERNGPMC